MVLRMDSIVVTLLQKELFLGYMHGTAQNPGRQGDTHAERICAKASSNLYGSHGLLFPLLPSEDLSSFLRFVQLLITLLFTELHRIPVTPPSLLPSLSAALTDLSDSTRPR